MDGEKGVVVLKCEVAAAQVVRMDRKTTKNGTVSSVATFSPSLTFPLHAEDGYPAAVDLSGDV